MVGQLGRVMLGEAEGNAGEGSTHRLPFWWLNACAGLSGLGWQRAPTLLLSPGPLPQDALPGTW